MTDTRPDPDALLEQINAQAEKAARGRLRIYFGSSAGVGKTYAMLAAAAKLRAEGIDVLAGVVETHGRAETAGQLRGLALLPPVMLSQNGRSLAEFDLENFLII